MSEKRYRLWICEDGEPWFREDDGTPPPHFLDCEKTDFVINVVPHAAPQDAEPAAKASEDWYSVNEIGDLLKRESVTAESLAAHLNRAFEKGRQIGMGNQDERYRLKQRAESAKASEAETEYLKSEVNRWHKSWLTAVKEIDELKQRAESAEQANTELRDKNNRQREYITRGQEQYEVARIKNENLQAEVERLTKDRDILFNKDIDSIAAEKRLNAEVERWNKVWNEEVEVHVGLLQTVERLTKALAGWREDYRQASLEECDEARWRKFSDVIEVRAFRAAAPQTNEEK